MGELKNDILQAITQMERRLNQRIDETNEKIDQVMQAVRELKDDHEEIEYLNSRIETHDKQIWKTQRLYKELYKELKTLSSTQEKKSGL